VIYYQDFILNEAKIDEIKEGDFVVFDKDFRSVYGCKGKLAKVESIAPTVKYLTASGVVKDIYYTFKIIKPDIPEDQIKKSDYNVFVNWRQTDTFKLSKGQVSRNVTKLTEEEANNFKKGRLVKFECNRLMEKILKNMKFRIIKKYIDSTYYNIENEKEDLVSYIPVNKYKKELVNPYKASFRQTIKVGKFLKKLNPELTDAKLEKFINSYKASWHKYIKLAMDRLKIITGEDIREWYYQKNYGFNDSGQQGTLGNSCMRYARAQRRFDIYCENPDKIAMAIYLNELGELMARALIWKLDNNVIFMDRIYHVDYASEEILHNYALEKKMKTYKDGYQNKNIMEIKLDKNYGRRENNPYMDTMRYFNFKTYNLVNNKAISALKNSWEYYTYIYND
jgi:hypothetical protein